jgi:hypothetical protein
VRLGLFPQPVDVIPLPNGTTVHVMRSVTERSTLGFLCITVTSRFGDEVARFDTAHGEPHIHRGDRRDVLGAMPDNADEGASYMSEHYGTWYDTMIGIAERTDRV